MKNRKIKNYFRWAKSGPRIMLLVFVFLILCMSVAVIYVLKFKQFSQTINTEAISSPISTKSPDVKWVLEIPSLKIFSPVVLNVNASNKDEYFKALEDGVAQMQGTAQPGHGNTVIFGHSSFYETSPGEYKTIFESLNKLREGDIIVLAGNLKNLTYEVDSIDIVDPKDVEVISPTKESKITLITCWPPGSIDNRLVVVAKLVQ